MAESHHVSILDHFDDLDDPRVERTRRHKLVDIIAIAICATICGADSWVHVDLFGRSKLEWFQTFLELPNGVPSHDTFGDVFARLDPAQFQNCFVSWTQAIAELLPGAVVAIDGKTARRSYDYSQTVNKGHGRVERRECWAITETDCLDYIKRDDALLHLLTGHYLVAQSLKDALGRVPLLPGNSAIAFQYGIDHAGEWLILSLSKGWVDAAVPPAGNRAEPSRPASCAPCPGAGRTPGRLPEHSCPPPAGPPHPNVHLHWIHPSHPPKADNQPYRRRRAVQFPNAASRRSTRPRGTLYRRRLHPFRVEGK